MSMLPPRDGSCPSFLLCMSDQMVRWHRCSTASVQCEPSMPLSEWH